ncbi:MAG: hypothetical protein ACP5VR_12395, partial [Acidimicrobiales bacterium]
RWGTATSTQKFHADWDNLHDAAGRLHLLASLLAEASSRLAGAVAQARAEGLSWAEVADLLGVTRASAWQHYASHCLPGGPAEEP